MAELVEFKNTIALHIKQNKLVDDVIKKIKEIPNLDELRLDPELTKYICNVIKILLQKKKKNKYVKRIYVLLS